MSLMLRAMLCMGSVFMASFVLRRIRKSRMLVEDAIFWIFLASVLIVLSVFPGIATYAADVLGVQSPANLVFLVALFLLIFELFTLVSKVAKLQQQVIQLTQRYAIDTKKEECICEEKCESV